MESLKEVDWGEEEKRIVNDNYVVEAFNLDDRVDLIKRIISKHIVEMKVEGLTDAGNA